MSILIQYNNVDVQRKENIILANVSFELRSGEFLYIIGKVGSGKSSLLKTIYCEIPISVGTALVLGNDISSLKEKEIPYLRRKIGIVFQDFKLLTDRSVHNNLEFVLRATGWYNKSSINERIESVLHLVGMETKGYKMPHELSGGEQQRIVIARALLNSPEIILADEPTGNLDPDTGKQIVQLLQDICKKGTAVVMVTHNHQIIKEYPGRILRCQNNTLEKGIPDIETP